MKATSQGATAPSKFVSAIFASKTPEGLTLKEYSWGNEYRGTESAFIESGFIKSEWLPGKLLIRRENIINFVIPGLTRNPVQTNAGIL